MSINRRNIQPEALHQRRVDNRVLYSHVVSVEPCRLIFVIVGEFLVASSGLGYRLNFYSTSYNTNGTFAMLLVMMALMMGLNALMVFIERYALRWRAEMTDTIQTY